MYRLLIAASLLSAAPALAQQQSASDRVALQIGRLVIQIEQQQDLILQLQAQLKAEQDKSRAKAEPGPSDKKE